MMLSRARPSRLGLNALCEPRKPMRSARVESSVMRIIFGLPAARREAGREIEIRKPRRINRAARNMKNSLNAWRPRSETDQLAGCGKSLNRDDSPPQGLKPSLILHDLRGAKAPLYHSAAGFRDFFRSLPRVLGAPW